MKFSVVIAYYKNQTALELIIKALENQTFQDFEVIIAEDDVRSEFQFLSSSLLKDRIKHVYQAKDNGFTKNATLNLALKAATSTYILFVDGDCVPHKHMVKAYDKWMQHNAICFGRRVMLGPIFTEKLYASKDLKMLNFFKIFGSDSRRVKYMFYLPFIRQERSKGIWGHNWCVAKQHLIDINGFDEDYVTAGVGEDVDIEWRLLAKGLKLYSIRFAAIQFHLHHKENYNNMDVETGKKQLAAKMQIGSIVCKNGLNKI
ncbi:MAG: glycosyltransferase [Saprospiraceae bacterium]|nr:glycosyltransferase [Saprospiraceae bacterium]